MIGEKRIYPPGTDFRAIMTAQGPNGLADVGDVLRGRRLLHYVLRRQVGRFGGGRGGLTFVTPTPYSPEETISCLALPAPNEPREYVLLLDPYRLGGCRIYGPRWVFLGTGIEFILPDGFPGTAIVDVAQASPGGPGRWELEVR